MKYKTPSEVTHLQDVHRGIQYNTFCYRVESALTEMASKPGCRATTIDVRPYDEEQIGRVISDLIDAGWEVHETKTYTTRKLFIMMPGAEKEQSLLESPPRL